MNSSFLLIICKFIFIPVLQHSMEILSHFISIVTTLDFACLRSIITVWAWVLLENSSVIGEIGCDAVPLGEMLLYVWYGLIFMYHLNHVINCKHIFHSILIKCWYKKIKSYIFTVVLCKWTVRFYTISCQYRSLQQKQNRIKCHYRDQLFRIRHNSGCSGLCQCDLLFLDTSLLSMFGAGPWTEWCNKDSLCNNWQGQVLKDKSRTACPCFCNASVISGLGLNVMSTSTTCCTIASFTN